MLINFASEKVKPIIKCSAPANEDGEVSNLISSNPMKLAKGFVAYPCIRPPVDISLEFISAINIHHILLWPSVHSQKSTAFEILAASDQNSQLESIGKYFCDNLEEKTVLFYNGRTYDKNNVSHEINNTVNKCNLKSSCWKISSNCCRLTIRILRTKNSVPCLGKVEVWGFVSRNCPAKLKELISNMYFLDPKTTNISESLRSKQKESSTTKTEINSVIPDDFLDAITFEVMSKPITLPSGNTIDESTLEKHNQMQEKWARAPFDPFTGKKFTKDSKPLFNSALKRRIDNFLIMHQDNIETKNIARTVGATTVTSSDISMEPKSEAENHLVDPLDRLLNNAFKNLKRYSSMESSNLKKKQIASCSQCNKTDQLYILTCKHFLCKNCISAAFSMKKKTSNCTICSLNYSKNDITRYHETVS